MKTSRTTFYFKIHIQFYYAYLNSNVYDMFKKVEEA